jgi:DNA-directed RNA polymerase specialized sigma24 family protein
MRRQQTNRSPVAGSAGSVNLQKSRAHRVSYEAGVRGLLIGCGQGDMSALGRLYDETIDWVYPLVRGVKQDESSAAALTTDAYRRVWVESPRFGPSSGCALSWILRQIREAFAAVGRGRR